MTTAPSPAASSSVPGKACARLPGACLHCGATIPPHYHGQTRRFCRPSCRSAWHRTQRRQVHQALELGLERTQAILTRAASLATGDDR